MIDRRQRCPWVDTTKPDYVAYHDDEWGVPVHDDRRMFEFLTLESAQAGLSWYTILRKREGYRSAFADFDAQKVARFSAARIEKLMLDPGIVRNRLKITSAVQNAKRFLEVQDEFGSFCDYLWRYVDGTPVVSRLEKLSDYPPRTPLSDAISKDLKKRGFRFVGTTIVYAHLQATGLVNDHALGCFRRKPLLSRGSSPRR